MQIPEVVFQAIQLMNEVNDVDVVLVNADMINDDNIIITINNIEVRLPLSTAVKICQYPNGIFVCQEFVYLALNSQL